MKHQIVATNMARKEVTVSNGRFLYIRKATEQELKNEVTRRIDVLGSDYQLNFA